MSLVPTASDLPDLPRQHHRDGACNVTWVAVMHPTLMLGLHRRPVALVSDQAQSRVMVSHAQSCWLPLMRAAAMNQVRKILDRGRWWTSPDPLPLTSRCGWLWLCSSNPVLEQQSLSKCSPKARTPR